MSGRGYFGIGIEHVKKSVNIGTLWRSANIFNAAFLFTINRRYEKQGSDTMASERHIPMYHYPNLADFTVHRPDGCKLVGIELVEDSLSLPEFQHPERCIYLLGAEDHGLSQEALAQCDQLVQIPTAKEFCLNVSVAGSLVMYDRYCKGLYKPEAC